MKKTIIYALIWVGMLPTLVSCEKWFDVSPRVEIKEDDLYKNESGFFDALVGVYSLMAKSDLYGNQLTMGFMDAVVQDYYIPSSAHPLYYALKFDYKNTRIQPLIDEFWNNMYEAVVNVNNLLANLEKADQSMFSDDNYELIKGEALALRAYLHFDLLRLYGPSFKMDKNRKCMPYVKTVSKQNTAYSSPVEVVEQCVADLQQALGYLQNDPVQNAIQNEDNIYRMNRRTRLNLYAVQGVLARVYLYAENKAKAAEYAGMLVDKESLPLTTNMQGVKNDRIFSGELLFAVFVDNLSSWADDYFNHSALGYDLQQLEFYLDVFFDKNAGLGQDIRYTEQFTVANSNGKLKKYLMSSSDYSNSKYRVPMLRLSEMYYIAAECTDDLGEASRLLNLVRKARGLEEKTFSGFPDVETYLTAEYRREFYGEGQLFYRYKRLNSPTIGEGYLIQNISTKMEEVYVFPLPDQEKEFGGVADQTN